MSKTKTLLQLAVIVTSVQWMSCLKKEASFNPDSPFIDDVCTAHSAFDSVGIESIATDAGISTLRETAQRIEAEDYSSMNGVQIESCREGGRNVGYISAGDWMDYSVTLTASGSQQVSFRVAGPGGTLQLRKVDGTVLTTVKLPATAGGQVYATTSATVNLPAGKQALRVQSVSAGWNFNWMEFAGGGTAPPTGSGNAGSPTGNGVTLISGFEDVIDFKKWEKETCRSGSLVISSEVPARKGKYSARFELTKSDVLSYKYSRAEIRQKSFVEPEKWFGFSNYLPGDFVTDPIAEKIAQWHDMPDWNLGEDWRSPPISFGIANGRYYLHIMWAAAAVNTNLNKDGEKKVDLGPVDKMKWNDWVFHIKFSYKSDGILEVWKNKVKVFSQYGPNSFNDKAYPYFKVGIYKWGWDGWASYSPANKRVLYYDEIRIGNAGSNLNDVSPQ